MSEDLLEERPVDRLAAAPAISRSFGLMLTVLSLLGLAAAFTLAVDKYRILANPDFQPSCNLNPILSCGSVMTTDQAEVFGFPNPLIGVIAFSAVLALGVLAAGGVAMPRWVLGALATGSVLGVVFVHWLAFQSLYRIGALCPWCMVVWAVTVPIAIWSVLLVLRHGRDPEAYLDPDAPRPGAAARVVDLAWSLRFLLWVLWILAVMVLATIQFWDYWRTLL